MVAHFPRRASHPGGGGGGGKGSEYGVDGDDDEEEEGSWKRRSVFARFDGGSGATAGAARGRGGEGGLANELGSGLANEIHGSGPPAQAQGGGVAAGEARPVPGASSAGVRPFFCEVCALQLAHAKEYLQHVAGRRHAKAQEVAATAAAGGAAAARGAAAGLGSKRPAAETAECRATAAGKSKKHRGGKRRHH